MIYLMRHAETSLNRYNILNGSGDTHINDFGRYQAKKVSEFFRDKKIDKVFSSSMIRARQTAEIILESISSSLPIELVQDIVECNFGVWEGLTWKEVAEKFHIDYSWYKSDTGYRYPKNGESYSGVLRRIKPFFDSLNKNENILVVSHGIVNKCYLSSLLGISLSDADKIPQDNCCINIISKQLSINYIYNIE